MTRFLFFTLILKIVHNTFSYCFINIMFYFVSQNKSMIRNKFQVCAQKQRIAQKLLHRNIPILLIWLAISILVTLRYKPSVFHNQISLFGALQKFFGRFAIFSEKVNKESCIGCKLCERVCPSDAIAVKSEDKKAAIETSLCLQCTSCQQVCPKDAIHYLK